MLRCLAPLSASVGLVALAGAAPAQAPRVGKAGREEFARGDPVLEAALAWPRE